MAKTKAEPVKPLTNKEIAAMIVYNAMGSLASDAADEETVDAFAGQAGITRDKFSPKRMERIQGEVDKFARRFQKPVANYLHRRGHKKGFPIPK